MKKLAIFVIGLSILLAACSSKTEELNPTQITPQKTSPPQNEIEPTNEIKATSTNEETSTEINTSTVTESENGQKIVFAGNNLPTEHNKYFSGSGLCAACHTNIKDQNNEDVSIDTSWRSTMMANAARDPYWLATVMSEEIENPKITETIEDKCSTCHMPLARTSAVFDNQKGAIFGNGFLNPNNDLHRLAMDGVSCTLCHQIQSDNLGNQDSFSGGFIVRQDQPEGERTIFGPFPTQQKLAAIMQGGSGFIPSQSKHMEESDLCGICHTLYTPTINKNGEVVGEFPEQTAYLEWLQSDYKNQKSCQDCHMQAANGNTQISNIAEKTVSPFRKHTFVGGNIEILNLFRNYGEEMELTSSSEQLESTINLTRQQLENQTATISITNIQRVANFLNVDIAIKNLSGHKFPTGYPSRRAWIHFTIQSADGSIIFESGNFDKDGKIIENDNDQTPTSFEPHYQIIENASQVQIYESIIHNTEKQVTTKLLRGNGYLKDNRILPKGFSKEEVQSDIAVLGNAFNDPDFIGGEDQVFYRIDLAEFTGPITITAEIYYQSISYRWIQNLQQFNANEIDQFFNKYNTISKEPILISSDTKIWTPDQ